ncbi:MAG: GNAT family N-acetyltransferase [Pseudomonadota bacterium]
MTETSRQVALTVLQPEQLHMVAALWHEGWHDAHAEIVPDDLVALRTLASFHDRLNRLMNDTRVAVDDETVLGFCILKGDELNQMYVARAARGMGLAQTLMQDAEDRLRNAGHVRAWLACGVGNNRAARFYEKSGWTRAGLDTVNLDTSVGAYSLEICRYEKDLSARQSEA